MSKTILLADDSLTIQKVVELTFADTEYQVVSMSSGDDLILKLGEVSPDLVICDIIMPGRDGYEVCQEIKSDPATLHIPVILLSGTFEPFDRDRALAAGCSEIITKPFEARKLVDTVEQLLGSQVVKAEAPAETAEIAPDELTTAAEQARATQEASEAPDTFLDEVPAAADALSEAAPGSEASDDSGLDFTDTGFAEMEAAAEARRDITEDLPKEGIEFEFSDEHEAFASPEDTGDLANTDTQPEIEVEAESEVEVTTDEIVEIEDIVESEEDEPETPPELEESFERDEFAERGPDSAVGPDPSEVPEAPIADDASIEFTEAPEPFAAPSVDEPELEVSAAFEHEPFVTEKDRHTEDEEVEPDGETPMPETIEIDDHLETSPETIAIPPYESSSELSEPPAEPEESSVAESHEPETEASPPTSTDTGPVTVGFVPSTPETEPEIAVDRAEPELDSVAQPTTDAAISELSDEEIDRIARRLLELASDRIEQIAWEIVPDMAEIVVRRRIREIESEAGTPPDSQ